MAGVRVVIADDESALRSALSDLIGREPDLEVVGTAADADEAVRLAREHEPDIALVDVKMPGGGGPRAAREIRATCELTKVLALSAYEDRATVLEMIKAGAVGYIVKGSAPCSLVDSIRRAVDGQASLSIELLQALADDPFDLGDAGRSRGVRQRSEERFRGLLESAPDAVVISDSEGRIVLVNAEAERMFGYVREELIGQPIDRLLPDRFRPQHVGHRARYLENPETRPMGVGLDLAGRRRDGSEFAVDISLSTIETEDGRLVTAFVRDITERLAAGELQRSLAERRAMLAHLVTVGEEERQRIAADIHDDSIQVITAAGMRLQILRDELEEPDHLQLLDHLEETIQLSIARLRHLLFELRPPALDRDGLVAALRMYIAEAGDDRPGATLYELSDRLSSQPDNATRLIIYRIVQEALTNARKHSGAELVRILLEEQEEGYLVTVADDGSGFSPEEAGEAQPGHLGLATIRERAELAGGWLNISSAVGMGTTVQFWIPRAGWHVESDGGAPLTGAERPAALQ